MTDDQPRSATARASGDRGRERRRSTRFTLPGKAWFEWESIDGGSHEGEGITRNVSKSGTFIETQSTPPVAAPLRVIVTLSRAGKEELQARLCGIGEVRHVSTGAPGRMGFGAWVVFHTEAPAEAG
jgi:hypothetical protein